jgi:hypothetical protein
LRVDGRTNSGIGNSSPSCPTALFVPLASRWIDSATLDAIRSPERMSGKAPAVRNLDAWVTVDAQGHAHVESAAVVVPFGQARTQLVVNGSGLRDLQCRTDLGRAVIQHGPNEVRIDLGPLPSETRIHLAYALDLDPLDQEVSSAWVLGENNLPHVPNIQDEMPSPTATPWCGPPKCTVHVKCSDPSIVAMGPEYKMESGHAIESGWTTISHYDGADSFSILVARLQAVGSRDVPVFVLDVASGNRLTAGYGEVENLAALVRQHFTRWLGEAPVYHRGVVLYAAASGLSSSLGSFLLINVKGIIPELRAEEQRAELLRVLAHEYAHSWWSYGTVWDSRQVVRLANEVLASTCESLVAVGLGDSRALRVIRGQHLLKVASSLGRSAAWLRGKGASFAGAWAAAPLIAISNKNPTSLEGALHKLWMLGHDSASSLSHLRDVLDGVAPDLGEVVSQTVRDPRPFVVVARAVSVAETGGLRWHLNLKLSRRPAALKDRLRGLASRGNGDEAELIRRLRLMDGRSTEEAGAGHGLTYAFKSLTELNAWVRAVRGSYFVLGRDAVVIEFAREPGAAKAWSWALRTLQINRPPEGVSARLRLLAAGFFALASCRDEPAGFRGLARVADLFSSRLARRLEAAALARERVLVALE